MFLALKSAAKITEPVLQSMYVNREKEEVEEEFVSKAHKIKGVFYP